ncbi:MAG: YkoF family thiamine/hydroxymethylpyrimidine-binding protein [Rhodospirillaceae bacterium]|nr:YkoF family thiamine/hydroxymethylpyrimidine-binding protein [Rhodospirillaceae bacterium]
MRITAEISLYPLRDDYIPTVQSFIHVLREQPGIEICVNQMSTQLTGELRDVSRAVERTLEKSFESDGPQALVAKYLNADLPLDEPPDLGA